MLTGLVIVYNSVCSAFASSSFFVIFTTHSFDSITRWQTAHILYCHIFFFLYVLCALTCDLFMAQFRHAFTYVLCLLSSNPDLSFTLIFKWNDKRIYEKNKIILIEFLRYKQMLDDGRMAMYAITTYNVAIVYRFIAFFLIFF